MSERRPFHRPQPRYWWAHRPYLAYTLRELTGVAVALYGAILLAGLVCLWRGPQAFDVYRQVLAGGWSLLAHLVLLAAMLWHVVTWFQILPKTLPKLIVDGKQVPQERITTLVLRAVGFGSVCLVLLTIGFAR